MTVERLFSDRAAVQRAIMDLKEHYQAKVNCLTGDLPGFFRFCFGFAPTDYQTELIDLFEKKQFVVARWPRQSGKSMTISALLLRYALDHPDSYIGVVGPSWRQTKLNIKRITRFLNRIPSDKYLKPGRTVLRFANGSVIEAFPNNPDTIRGPTLDVVWWDETNFTSNDVDLYDAVLFTLGTTNGKLICTSTPWNTDSLFWKMCNHRDFEDFGRHHVSWERAQEPNGPLKKEILDRIRKQCGEDPSRWRREMEAEWAEDENAWLPQSLIVSSIGTVKNCGEDLQPWNPEVGYSGDLFVGLDLAQVRDYCVLSVFDRVNDVLFLRHLKIFSQPTKYANVLGYVKALQDRWDGFQKIRVDFTKEGPSIISDMEDAGIKNVEGVSFSIPRKSEMASLLKQRIMNQHLFYPHLVWEKPYRSDICTELNVERYELRKDGTMALNHPTGTHDDVFWSLALSVYATVDIQPLDLDGTIRFG